MSTVPVVVEPKGNDNQLVISNVVEDVTEQHQTSFQGGNGNGGPILTGLEAPATYNTPLLRVDLLKPHGGNGNFIHDSSFCTSEEEGGGSHDYSEDGDGDHSGNNSSIPDLKNLMLENEAFIEPDEQLQEKIISLVEFYFSDDSILKDAFLLKHVRRNRFGFVSIKLITSFKKMKTLTKDYRVVAFSLRNSEKLELNEECTKVRRKEPVPDYDETVPSRTVVALNLPFENPTMENISEIFSKCGCIANFRILKPGCSIPSDLTKFAHKHPDLGKSMCAAVAFENFDQAKKACEILNSDDWRQTMKVYPLMISKKKEDKKEKREFNKKDKDKRSDRDKKMDKKCSNDKNFDKDKNSENDSNISPDDGADDKKKRRQRGRKKKTRVDELSHDSSCYSSGSEGDSPKNQLSVGKKHRYGDHLSPKNANRGDNKVSPVASPHNRRKNYIQSPLVEKTSLSPRSSPETRRRVIDSSGGDSAPSSPWVQRRLRVAQETAVRSPLGSPLLGRRNPDGSFVSGSVPRMLDMTNVLRQPKGPDDTKGFYGGMGRGKPRSSTFT